MSNRHEVTVELGEAAYPVIIGSGVKDEVTLHVPPRARRAAIVTQENIGVSVETGIEQRVFAIGEGEKAKVPQTIVDLCEAFATWGLNRNDVVVGVGGGVVTDVAGFAASVFHRGIPVIHVSTSLLGQVDAAIGGKTGVNLPAGKNLFGSYWQPTAVFCDLDTLTTLPPRHYQAGLGEMAKYHFLGSADFSTMPLDEQIAEAVRLKAEVVASDEREGGRRALLNYGHTLAHALETAGDHELLHGEAVAIGLVYAAEVAHAMGRISTDRVAEHRRLVSSHDLSTRPPTDYGFDRLLANMRRDKKALSGLTLVLDGADGVEVVEGVDEADLFVGYERLIG